VVISVVAFALGYQARIYFTSSPQAAKSINSSSTSATVDLTDKPKTKTIPTSGSGSDSDSESELDTDSEAEDLALALSSNPQSLKPTSFDEVKLVLIVNESLKMTKGKIAAQAGHATLSCALMMKDVNPRMYKHWERHG
jgi:PTH2 family peptidyl-tRNA hydrolase